MSDILTGIKQRLSTDIGDLARASIDPNFSRQLTEANFRDKAFQKERKAALEDRAAANQQQRELQDRRTKIQTQLYAAGIAVNAGNQKGDWEPLKRMVDSNAIDPLIAPEFEMLANAGIPQGLEWALKEGDAQIKARNATSAELANELRKEGLTETRRNNIRKMFLEKSKLNFEKAEAQLDQATESDNADVVKNFFDNTDMLTEEERPGWQEAVKGNVSGPQAINVMNRFLDQKKALFTQELKNQQKKGTDPNAFPVFKYLNDDYQQQSKPMRAGLRTIGEIQNILNQPHTPASDKALTAKVTELFSTNVRALQELEQWKNLGNLGERVGGFINRFLSGKRTEAQMNELNSLIEDYKVDMEESLLSVKANSYDQSVDWQINPNKIMPEDADSRYEVKPMADGRTVRIDHWRKTVEEINGQ